MKLSLLGSVNVEVSDESSEDCSSDSVVLMTDSL